MLDTVEATFNEVSDMDAGWWPFLFLRPRKEERMGSRRVMVVSALYGIFVGLLIDVVLRFAPQGTGGATGAAHPALYPLGATVALFLFYRATFAYFWNRRAERLSNARARWNGWRRLGQDAPEPEEDP